MYCVLIHAVCFSPYIEFSCMYCASLHVLYFPACIVCCVMACAWLHALCAISYIPFCFMHTKFHFGHISVFLRINIQNFFVFRIDNLYFPLLLDIQSLTSLIYVQFSLDSIPFSHTLSLILDISCHFLFFISNFYPAQFFFHPHRS